MKKLLLKIIRMYKKNFSVLGVCRMYPTCSEYTYVAIDRHGVCRGLFLGLRRILKCNRYMTPETGTYDPVI